MKKGKGGNNNNINQEQIDTYKRMNFLYQAAFLVNLKQHGQSSSRHLIKECRQVGQKLVLRMDPHIKRSLCKACNTILLPGRTCRVELDEKAKVIVYHCQVCKLKRSLPTFPDKPLFTDTAIVSQKE